MLQQLPNFCRTFLQNTFAERFCRTFAVVAAVAAESYVQQERKRGSHYGRFEALLLNWPVTYTLNQGKYRSKIRDGIQQGGAAAEKFQRLEELISHNLSYRVFQAIRTAKAALSTTSE